MFTRTATELKLSRRTEQYTRDSIRDTKRNTEKSLAHILTQSSWDKVQN